MLSVLKFAVILCFFQLSILRFAVKVFFGVVVFTVRGLFAFKAPKSLGQFQITHASFWRSWLKQWMMMFFSRNFHMSIRINRIVFFYPPYPLGALFCLWKKNTSAPSGNILPRTVQVELTSPSRAVSTKKEAWNLKQKGVDMLLPVVSNGPPF